MSNARLRLGLPRSSRQSRGSPTLPRKYDALCKVYRGKSNKFLHSFASTRDKRHWSWQLEMYLFAEIDPEFWPTKGHRG